MAVRLPRLEATAPSPGFLQLQWQKLCRLLEEAFDERDTTLARHTAQIGGLEVGMAGGGYTYQAKNATYSETAISGELVIGASGTFTINLPTAVGNTAKITVKLISAGAVTLDPTGAQTIDGGATIALSTLNEAVTIVSDGANWLLI